MPATAVRASRFVAGGVALTSLALFASAVVALSLPGTERYPDRPSLLDLISFITALTALPVIGFIVATRRPDSPIGWLFLVAGLCMAVGIAAGDYVAHVRYGGYALPAVSVVAWFGVWVWFVAIGIAIPLAILLFPDGRFLSRRWRAVATTIAGVGVIVVIATAVSPFSEASETGVSNPFAIGGAAGEVATAIAAVADPLLIIGVLVAPLSVIARFRRSQGVVRQQLKWFGFAISVLVLGILGLGLAAALVPEIGGLAWNVVIGGLALIPISVGIAILRHRLFDIDVVIRRTLVYGAVVGMLAAVYVALVLILQAALSGLTGGGTLPVALSTLAIAALFGPVRAKVRELVDRRFFRSRYDTQLTLEAFAGRLRDEVELEAVANELLAVARQAIEPVQAGVWLRRRAL